RGHGRVRRLEFGRVAPDHDLGFLDGHERPGQRARHRAAARADQHARAHRDPSGRQRHVLDAPVSWYGTQCEYQVFDSTMRVCGPRAISLASGMKTTSLTDA